MTKHNITVCMGSSCFARGNQQNLETIENFIKENGLEAEIELSGSRCEGKCVTGPNEKILPRKPGAFRQRNKYNESYRTGAFKNRR